MRGRQGLQELCIRGQPSTSACSAQPVGAWLTRSGGRQTPPGQHRVAVSKTGRRGVGILPEQVAFQPMDGEDRAAGSWVQVAGRETRDFKVRLGSARKAGVAGLWWERGLAGMVGGAGP